MPGGGYQGHRSDEWTDYELQLLYDHASDPRFLDKLCPIIDRTRSAIYQRMCALRREAELKVAPPSDEDLDRISRLLAESDRLLQTERATAACNDRRPDTSE